MKKNYIPQNQRKKILLVADDIRSLSGVASMAREIVIETAHHYNWVSIGGSITHPENGRQLDLSGDTNTHADITDSYVKLYPTNGYGSPELIRSLIDYEKPDAMMLFTDPRYFVWIFQMENEIRKKIPILYYNIWDDCLFPPMYNKPYYESCDGIFGISRQTLAMNKVVLGDKIKDKVLKYIPHGVNEKHFYPVEKTNVELTQFKNQIFGGKQYEFVMFFNSRNIRRKNIQDTLWAYKIFCDKIGAEKSSKCAFIIHAIDPVSEHGTDLFAVKEMLFDKNDPRYNIIFSTQPLSTPQMNLLYNSVDVVTLLSTNEGYGISLNEARMCGKMIIPAVQGGMVDQCRFENDKGEWLDFEEGFLSNSFGTYKNHGEWVIPVYPSNLSMVGSVPTPYIVDDRIDFRDAAKAFEECYNLGDQERTRRGLKGREWTISAEAMMTSKMMGEGMVEAIDELFSVWKPRKSFKLTKIEDRPHSGHYVDFKMDKYIK